MSSVTKEALLERLAGLRLGRQQIVDNLNVQDGAIQDCEYWLGMLDKAEEKTADGNAPRES